MDISSLCSIRHSSLFISLLFLLLLPMNLWAIGHPYLVKDINPSGNSIDPYMVNPAAALGDAVIVAANDGATGTELWKSDGTASGTLLLKDINPGSPGSSPLTLTPLNGKVVFRASNPESGNELWVTDGTSQGTQMLADIYPGTGNSTPQKFTRLGSTLYFVASTPDGSRLWKTDGTTAGTMQAAEFTPGFISSIDSLTTDNDRLLVLTTLSSMTVSWNLWSVDAANGTVPVKTFLTQPRNITSCNGKIYFSLSSGTSGDELWMSDGTDSGTVMLKDINPGGSSSPSYLTCSNAALFFRATDPSTGTELWKSDGTSEGTLLVKDLYPGASSSSPGSLKLFNGKILFLATGAGTGSELWISDGTEVGTFLLKDINPGPGGYPNLTSMAQSGSLAVFSAIDGVHGDEVWVTDGTTENTYLLADLRPGADYASPGNFAVAGNTLYFSAYDTALHYQLMAVPLTPAPHSLITAPLTGSVVSSPTVIISGEAHSDTGSPVALVEVSIDGGSSYFTASGAAAWTFETTLPSDGVYSIRSRATDSVGTVETAASSAALQMTLDTAPPSGMLKINSNAATTTSTQVSLEITASAVDPGVACEFYTDPFICGTVSIRYSNNGTGWSSWSAAQTAKAWTLMAGDGEKTVYAQLKDRAGNITDISDTIMLSTSLVPGSTIISPVSGSATNGTIVTVSGSAAPGPGGGSITLVEVSGDGGSTWQPATGTTSWSITLNYPVAGIYTIKCRATAGTLVETPGDGITINIDRTAPSGNLSLYYGVWTLNANANDGGVCTMQYPNICGSLEMSFNGTDPWIPAATSPGTGGPLWLRDRAGNLSYIPSGNYTNTNGGPIQMISSPTAYYSLVQHAYDAALNNDLIKLSTGLTEQLTLSRTAAVTIRGGYDSGFSAVTGTTPVTGNMAIQAGSATIENIDLSGVMTVEGGAVSLSGVSIL